MEPYLVSFCVNKKSDKTPVFTNSGLRQNNRTTGTFYLA